MTIFAREAFTNEPIDVDQMKKVSKIGGTIVGHSNDDFINYLQDAKKFMQSQLKLKYRLANGTFGVVWSGILCNKQPVAIKVCNAKEYEKELFHEVRRNIIKLG